MGRRTLFAVAAAGLFALGCSSPFWGGPPPPVEDTRLVAVSPERALTRARHWLARHDFEIQKAHRHRTGWRLVALRDPFETGSYARCAWTFRMSGGVRPAARIMLSADAERAGRTRVQARTEISLVNGAGDRAECASRGLLERELLASISGG